MVTNYLLITHPTYDTGLVNLNLSPRQAWTDVWRNYPGRL